MVKSTSFYYNLLSAYYKKLFHSQNQTFLELLAFTFTINRPIVRDLVDDVIVVDDKEIIQAMKLCYEILKIAVEPSGAIGLAAVLSDGFRKNPVYSECNHIGIVLSGGNVDLGVLWNSFDK